MTCEDIRAHLALACREGLTPELAEHLAGCRTCAAEHAALADTWAALALLGEAQPSPALRERIVNPRRRWTGLAAAAALLLVAGGFGAGWMLRPLPASDPEAARQQGMLRLLSHPAPGERATGLALLGSSDTAPELLDSLLDRVVKDPDPRIRREAAEALSLFAGRPELRDRIVERLGKERDPGVQLALVDLLAAFREQAARRALRSLLEAGRLQGSADRRARALLQL